MPDIRVYGGLKPASAKRPDDILLDPAIPRGQPGHVTIKLHDITRRLVSDLQPRLLDLLEIAAYVYAADQLVRRDTLIMPRMGANWRRSFAFHVGVRDLAFWSRADVQGQLISTLQFLSEDSFKFFFARSARRRVGQAHLEFDADGSTSGFVPDEVMLFSGGLDSFAGVVEALQGKRRVALVSHRASPLVASFQKKLVQSLRDRFGRERLLNVSAGITRGSARAVEFTQRTRSFLFAVLGFLVAHLFDRQSVSFYENGVVSMNLPLATHVVGSRATRTTHPKVLHAFARLFSLAAERDVRVANPFFWKTKADIVRAVADLGCGDLIPSTFSCAAVRGATIHNGRHCGVCSQCLDRRFGVLAAECGRFEPSNSYDVDLFRGERKPGADTIMAESYVLTAHRYAESSEAAFLGAHAELLRAVPYLDVSRTEAVSRLHRLHKRHGQAVTAVVEKALTESNSISSRLALPDSSLLSMIAGSLAQDIVCVDPVEQEAPAAVQAEARTIAIIPRPISFAAELGRAVFASGAIVLRGKSAELINALLPEFQATLTGRSAARDLPYRRKDILAASLNVHDGALRQIVFRARAELATGFRDVFGAELLEDDVIQSRQWRGYRLSPHLAYAPALLQHGGVDTAAE